MKGNGKTIRLMEKEYINIKMERSMMVHGAKINSMVKAKKLGQMEPNILVFMLWEKNKEKGCFIGKMAVNMMENFMKII